MLIWRNLDTRLLGMMLLAATKQYRRGAARASRPVTAPPPRPAPEAAAPRLKSVSGGKKT